MLVYIHINASQSMHVDRSIAFWSCCFQAFKPVPTTSFDFAAMQGMQSDAAPADDANDVQSRFQSAQPSGGPHRPSPAPSGGVADKLCQALQDGSLRPTADIDPGGFTRTHPPIGHIPWPMPDKSKASQTLQAQLQQAAAVLAASQLTDSPLTESQPLPQQLTEQRHDASLPQQQQSELQKPASEAAAPTKIVTATVAVPAVPSAEASSQQAKRPTLLPPPEPQGPEVSAPSLMQALSQAQHQAEAIAASEAEHAAQADLEAQAQGQHAQHSMSPAQQQDVQHEQHSRLSTGQQDAQRAQHSMPSVEQQATQASHQVPCSSRVEAQGHSMLTDHGSVPAVQSNRQAHSQHTPPSAPSSHGIVQESFAGLLRNQQHQEAELDSQLPTQASPRGYNVNEAIRGKFQSLPSEQAVRSSTPERTATQQSPKNHFNPFLLIPKSAVLEQGANQSQQHRNADGQAGQDKGMSHQHGAVDSATQAVHTEGKTLH